MACKCTIHSCISVTSIVTNIITASSQFYSIFTEMLKSDIMCGKNKAFMDRQKEVLSEIGSASHFTTVISKETYTLTLHLKGCCLQCDKKSWKDLADLQVQALESKGKKCRSKSI